MSHMPLSQRCPQCLCPKRCPQCLCPNDVPNASVPRDRNIMVSELRSKLLRSGVARNYLGTTQVRHSPSPGGLHKMQGCACVNAGGPKRARRAAQGFCLCCPVCVKFVRLLYKCIICMAAAAARPVASGQQGCQVCFNSTACISYLGRTNFASHALPTCPAAAQCWADKPFLGETMHVFVQA